MDSWTSPSELAPSPKYTMTAAFGSTACPASPLATALAAASFWSRWMPMAYPTACGVWAARTSV